MKLKEILLVADCDTDPVDCLYTIYMKVGTLISMDIVKLIGTDDISKAEALMLELIENQPLKSEVIFKHGYIDRKSNKLIELGLFNGR